MMPPPKIVGEDIEEIEAKVLRRLHRLDLAAHPATLEPDLARTLTRIFAGMALRVSERINRIPQKAFVEYLNLIGVEARPAGAARVLLSFWLAPGASAPTLVRAGTPVAAGPGGIRDIVFETERDLVVGPTTLAAAWVHEPGRDLARDVTREVAEGGLFEAFRGTDPISHRLHIGHQGLLAIASPETVHLDLGTETGALGWPDDVAWSCWDGAVWRRLQAKVVVPAGGGRMTIAFEGLPPGPSPERIVDGRSSRWLRATLLRPLPRGDSLAGEDGGDESPLPLEVRVGTTRVDDLESPFAPFGQGARPRQLFLGIPPGSAGGRVVTFTVRALVSLDAPAGGLQADWTYWDGEVWRPLDRGTNRPSSGQFEDTTAGLSRDGWIRFRAPLDWVASVLGGRTQLWIRCEAIADTAKGWPRTVDTLSARIGLADGTSTGEPTRLDALAIEVRTSRDGVAPEVAFGNDRALDLGRGFLPFGEAPGFGDAFYLACEEVFARSTGFPGSETRVEIRLKPAPEPPSEARGALVRPASDLALAWEYWDEKEGLWAALQVEPLDLLKAGEEPLAASTKNLSSGCGVAFVLPRFVGLVAVNGLSRRWIRARIDAGEKARPIEVINLMDPAGPAPPRPRPPSLAGIAIGYRFRSGPVPPEVVLAENDFQFADVTTEAASVDGRGFSPFEASAEDRPSLALGFRGAMGGPASETVSLYLGVEPPERNVPEARGPSGSATSVVTWEYWDGREWSTLAVRDETEGLRHRGLLSFVVPTDLSAVVRFEMVEPLWWIRARWASGTFPAPPCLRWVLPHTTWASQASTARGEVLGSSDGRPGQVFQLAARPVLAGQKIEVREPTGSPSGDSWVVWEEAPDFLAADPESRVYLIDREAGTVAFGDGRRGRIPPAGRSNIRAATYRHGGGPDGNRPAGTIGKIRRSLTSIGGVVNREPAEGGSAAESLASVQRRGPRRLRHRDRAVTLVDFEDLAMEASPDVARARAERVAPGSIRVVIAPASVVRKPVPGQDLLEQVRSFLLARSVPTLELVVAGPNWVEVEVEVDVELLVPEAAPTVRTAILERLDDYLAPTSGGLEALGWAFGQVPGRAELHALVAGTPGVESIRHLGVRTRPDAATAPGGFLVFPGAHRVSCSLMPQVIRPADSVSSPQY